MNIENITLNRAKTLNLHGINEIEPDHKAIYVIHTSNKYQAKPWFYQAVDNCYCSCDIAGMSMDSENKQEIISYILKAIS